MMKKMMKKMEKKMKKRILQTTFAMLAAAVLLALFAVPQALAEGEKTDKTATAVHVLVLGHKLQVDPRLKNELAGQGIHLHRRDILKPLSLDMLKQFQVVFVGEGVPVGSTLSSHVAKAKTLEENYRTIEKYVDAGGGFLYTPDVGGYGGAMKCSEIMKRYEAKILPLQIRDDKHRYVPQPAPKRDAGYSWTDKISKHPATTGVKTIFYPTPQHRWDDFYSTPAMELNSDWTQLVSTMESGTASWSSTYTEWTVIKDEPQTIAAVRDYEKGRVGLLNVYSFYTFWHPYWEPKDHGKYGRAQIVERTTGDIDGIFIEKGDGTRKSQGRELLAGILRWLGENATKVGMGGYTEEAFAKLPVPAAKKAPAWLSKWNKQQKHINYKVLVGARSEYSNGSGSLADFAKSAKEAGLAMLCMAEPMEHFDLSKWREYYDACQALSDDTFQLIPGLDMQDAYGARYILLNSPVQPQPHMLSKDGKVLEKVEQLCINMPGGITIAHRVTSASAIPHQLTKHFQGISLYTYNGDNQLVDNSFPNYEWQMHSFSNPMPFVVHEVDAPDKLNAASQVGFQLYVNAPTAKDLTWYFRKSGLAHHWEAPLHMQVSSGPLLEEFGSDPFFTMSGENKITDVRLMYNYELYRRWTPNNKTFTVEKVQLPRSEVNWAYLVATDDMGGKLISSGILAGRQIAHTWRCADRQNWWVFPNIYTGTTVNGFDLKVPVMGSDEGTGGSGGLGFPQVKGPQRGDNLAPILEFSFASPEVYIQDVFIDQRYHRAIQYDIIFDAKPANATTRSRIFKARVRYHQFLEKKAPSLPTAKEIDITLRRPVTVETDIYPIITSLDMKNHRLRGDMSYAFTDPETGKEVSGILSKGTIDIPAGGRIGGLIVLSGTLRVARDNRVGFPVSVAKYTTLPLGTSWQASFITVPPAQAERWRKLIGVKGQTPYEITLTKGQLESVKLVANAKAEDNKLVGEVSKPLSEKDMDNLIASTSEGRKTPPMPLKHYRLPIAATGINGNWPVALWRPDGTYEEVSAFEDKAWARLDITKTGPFFFGNVVRADNPDLRIAIVKWTDKELVLELNNPTNHKMVTTIKTAIEIKDRFQVTKQAKLSPGSSKIVSWK